jgi:hypothetical protein
LTFTAFDGGSLMNTQGWHTYYARTGGWGHFPDDYTYRVVDAGGRRCVVDSYRFAQNHAQGTAILLDWGGNPAKGPTPLQLQPGMTVSFTVTLFLQPYAPNWKTEGTGHVIWGMGPGIFDPGAKPVSDDTPGPAYNWAQGRGPRFQYRLGYAVEGKDLPVPELLGYAPESADPALAGKTLPTGAWCDVRLNVTASADGKQGNCELLVRPSQETADWVSQGTWSFPINPASTGADNPARWNALLLDLPLGQWSKAGYGDPTPQMIDRIGALSVAVIPAGASGTPIPAQLLQGNRPVAGARVSGPTTVFVDESPT